MREQLEYSILAVERLANPNAGSLAASPSAPDANAKAPGLC